jgi:hypothetical protein
VLTQPGGDLQLTLALAEGDKLPVVTAALMIGSLNAFVAGPGDLEVDRVDAVRDVETVVCSSQWPAPHSMTLMRVLGLAGPHLTSSRAMLGSAPYQEDYYAQTN